jgi:hypothetical protein
MHHGTRRHCIPKHWRPVEGRNSRGFELGR